MSRRGPWAPKRAVVGLRRVVLAALVVASAPPARAQADALDVARAHYDAGRYEQAFVHFAQRADAGDCEAARIAVLMRRFGPSLYGVTLAAEPARVQRWQRLAPCAADAAAGTPDRADSARVSASAGQPRTSR